MNLFCTVAIEMAEGKERKIDICGKMLESAVYTVHRCRNSVRRCSRKTANKVIYISNKTLPLGLYSIPANSASHIQAISRTVIFSPPNPKSWIILVSVAFYSCGLKKVIS
jgi:hypothetical protein